MDGKFFAEAQRLPFVHDEDDHEGDAGDIELQEIDMGK